MSIYVNARNLMTNYDESDIQAPYNDLLANASGIVTPGAMVVAPNSGMTIQVATGAVLQYISSLGNFYRVYSDAVTNLTIANNSSGSTRIDLICVKFDPTITPDANASNIATILIVLGTAGAGIPATPTNHYVLAEITVASGAASIGAGQITDKRSAVSLSTLLNSAIILTTGGGTTAYTLTPSPAITAYATGQQYTIKINATNTGASTINISGLGAKAITKNGATAIASGDLTINAIYTITYDGTQFQVSGIGGAAATVATQAEVATGTDNTKMVTPLGVSRWHMPPQGYMYNGKIVPSVSGGALTVAIKTLAGTDPSASDPVYVRIGDTIRTITAALATGSLTTGSNWFNSGSAELATKEIDYFVYLLWNTVTSAVAVVLSRVPYAGVYSDLSNSYVNEKYGYIAGTAPNNTDQLEVIGRFAATLSAGSGYTWTVPTFTATNLIQRPIYETRQLIWAPTVTGVTSPSFGTSSYFIKGNRISVLSQALDATSNATTKSLVLPMGSSATHYMVYNSGIFPCKDAGAHQTVMGHVSLGSSSSTLNMYKTWYQGLWTASGAWAMFLHELTYQI